MFEFKTKSGLQAFINMANVTTVIVFADGYASARTVDGESHHIVSEFVPGLLKALKKAQ